ncbi:MAG: hypothetical protein ABJE95_26915, partial [Byssovorax sp.]
TKRRRRRRVHPRGAVCSALATEKWETSWGLTDRIRAIDASPELALLETPTFKRTFREGFREIDIPGEARLWIARRAEVSASESTSLKSCSAIWRAFESKSVHAVVETCLGGALNGPSLRGILDPHAVPFLAACRHTDNGLDKHAFWERTWDLQRREDAGERLAEIPLPPKYDPKDFRDPITYRLRGKLDVPKERFISYPGCESDQDHEPVYGWAGWNHLQQAQALSALYQNRKQEEGWGKDRLTPMLAGLLELIPWIKQWHNEPSEEYGGLRLGEFFDTFLDGECRGLGLTRDDLRAWRPEAKKRGKGGAAKRAKAAADEGEDSAGDD